MLNKIKRWLAPPSFEGDEEKTIQMRIANTLILYLGTALLVVVFILIPLFAFQKIGSWILCTIMFCGIAAGRYFLFKGNYRLATVIVFSIIYLCILALLILSGGNSGTAMFYFATVVLVAGFFLEAGVVNGFTIATFLIGMGMSFLQERGFLSLPVVFKFNSAFSWVATGIGLLFMIRTRDLFVGNLKNALRLAHQQNLVRQQVEARFRAVVEYSSNGVVFMSAERKINYVSPAYQQLLGFTSEEMVGHFGPEYIHPEDSEITGRKFEELLQKPESTVIIEYRLQRKDGSYCWVETTATNLLDNPDVQAVVLNQRDINERKRAEEALKQSELKYRELFEVNKDGISIFPLDAHGNPAAFIEFNTAAHQMLGYTRDEMLELTPSMLEPHITWEQLQFRQSEFKAKGVANFETTLLHKNGHLVSTDFAAQLIQYEGRPAVMNIVRDITEREQYENELQAIATLSAALRAAQTRAEMLPVIVEQLISLLNCEAMTIEIIDPLTGEAVTEAAFGIWKPLIGVRQEKGTGINAIISQTRQPWYTNDLNQTASFAHREFIHKGIHGGIGAPLIAQDNLIGFVWMGRNREVANPEVRLLSSIADIAANAIHRATLHERTQNDAAKLARAYDSTLEGWAHALELRDQETEGHTRRVVEMTIDLARSMGVNEDEVIEIRRGALLHDIGKMGIPDSVLLKPGTLNEREWEIMRQHPDYAYRLLTPIEYLRPVLDIPYCHHERWDGTGYPRGLKNEEIPLAARIFAIVDVWDALTSDRPYRPAWSKEKAIKHISEQSNKHFDPAVVEAFLKIV